MKYEIQWVLHAHSANTIFPEEDRIIQKTLIEEYENVKSQLCSKSSAFKNIFLKLGNFRMMNYTEP